MLRNYTLYVKLIIVPNMVAFLMTYEGIMSQVHILLDTKKQAWHILTHQTTTD